MKILSVILLGVCMNVQATAFSQQTKVTLTMKQVSLNDLFREMSRQTKLDILYNLNVIKGKVVKDVNVKDKDFIELLEELLPAYGLEYSFDNNVVVVRENTVTQQQKEFVVKGIVVDEKNNSIPGVTIMVDKTIIGTVTDKDGKFSLRLSVEKGTLVFSFVGMKTQMISFTGQSELKVVMKEDNISIDEVVVTGYQTLKKPSIAGSISKVKAEDLVLDGTLTLEQALQGKVPGMTVMNTSGLTGTRQRIRVRGTSTLLGNAEPVWVVDGIIQEDPLPFQSNQLNNINPDNMDMIRNFIGGAISWLNPNEIEDVTVLKDASATAIYGVKAANGVIVITTKKGQQGRMTVSYSGNIAYSPRMTYDNLELMNSKERVDVSREAYERKLVQGGDQKIGYMGLALAYLRREISQDQFTREVKKLETANTDWFDILFQDAISHNHSISISGGQGKTSYRASLGVNNSNNTAKGNEQTRYTANMNISTILWDRLTFGISLAGSTSETKAFAETNPYTYASTVNRIFRCNNDDGSFYFYPHPSNGYLYNIVNELQQSGNGNKLSSTNANLSVRWRILESLSFGTQLSYAFSNSNGRTWYNEQSNHVAVLRGFNFEEFMEGSTNSKYTTSHLPNGGELNRSSSSNTNWSWRNQLEYTEMFNEMHSLTVMLGQEMRSSHMESENDRTFGYMDDRGKIVLKLPQLVPSGSTNIVNKYFQYVPVFTDTENNYVSYYATLNYMYDKRYAFNASVRADASNRFGQDKSARYQPVWALGARWNLGSEDWMQGQNLLSDMNLRATYGFQGNVAENVSPDLIATITAGEKEGYVLTIKNLPAPKLKWEKVQSINLGADFALFNRKVNGSFEYYYKKTTDMITERSVPYENGVSSRPINGGDMINKGWDASVSFVPVRTKDLNVSLGLTFGKVYNEIKTNLASTGSWREATSGNLNKKGYPVSSFWAFRFAGLSSEHGGPLFDRTNMAPTDKPAVPDATLYMNHVGKLDPDFTSGMTFSIRYKTFSLSSGLYLSMGNQTFLAPISNNYGSIVSEYENMSTEWLKRWRKPGDEKFTNIPSLPDVASNNQLIGISSTIVNSGGTYGTIRPYEMYAYSDIRVVDAWYIRCGNVSLSYYLPAKNLPVFLKNLSFSCNITNLFQIRSKDFLGRDPEVALGNQPLTRNISLGVSMSF